MVTELVVLPDKKAVAEEAARRVVRRVEAAVEARGDCAVVLSGGETPRPLYVRLAQEPYRDRIPWHRVRVFWGDERCVPPTDPRSNYRMAWETLLAHVPVPPDRVHRMPAEEEDLDAAAQSYEDVVASTVPRAPDGWPRFDLVLLGLGADGHTASLFPHSPVLREARRVVVAYRVPELDAWRMTLTPPALNHARDVLVLVAGREKAAALWGVLEGPRDPEALPAQLIRPLDGDLTWIVDADAASRLTRASLGTPPPPR